MGPVANMTLYAPFILMYIWFKELRMPDGQD